MEFAADARFHQIAEAYALDAVDFARQNFRLTLEGDVWRYYQYLTRPSE